MLRWLKFLREGAERKELGREDIQRLCRYFTQVLGRGLIGMYTEWGSQNLAREPLLLIKK